jgi:hypothetical protein
VCWTRSSSPLGATLDVHLESTYLSALLFHDNMQASMELTVSQSPSLRCPMMGFLSAGKHSDDGRQILLADVEHHAGFPTAAITPAKSMRMSSSLRRFQSSFKESRLAMSCLFDRAPSRILLSPDRLHQS